MDAELLSRLLARDVVNFYMHWLTYFRVNIPVGRAAI